MNDTLAQQITQTQQRLQEAHDLIQQNIIEINTCKNQIIVLTNENADLNNRLVRMATTPIEPNKSRDLISRITQTDLLKSKEIPSFNTKDSFELWSDYFKNDLYAKLPETKLLIDFAEKQHNDNIPLNKDIIKKHFESPPHGSMFDNISAPLIDNKLWSTLSHLTREHAIARSKLKLDNPEKSGTLAWYNLYTFYHQDFDEHKLHCFEYAMTIKHCTSLNELGPVLDKLLLACEKTQKNNNPFWTP